MRVRFYANLDRANVEEREVLAQRALANHTTQETSYLYVNEKTGRVMARDAHDGKMITVAGSDDLHNDGSYVLRQGFRIETARNI